ncbi:hypothetical protein B9W68_07795 [Streptomyces sp. CS227]|uniref:hypothetical protein n=1 Tax=Streptomyces sp. CS227 TaxID=1982763 RepID=UPI000B6C0A42|nr:hypothetical protein [Streptomyces sp. CS227]OWA16173.1 hypothetical protein B9W68_07795 [Streptomyces sp. CS227]
MRAQSGTSLGGSAFWRLSPLTWLIFFGLGALVNGVAHVFRTADVHEVLPPLVSVALVWVHLVVDLVSGKYGDAPDRVAAFLLGAARSPSPASPWGSCAACASVTG